MTEIYQLLSGGYPLRLFDWIPSGRFLGISFLSPHFLATCVPFVLLILLGCSRWWARFTDRPVLFALIHSFPLLILNFQNSLGDAVQWTENINGRYYMSEPGATWIHHWGYQFLHKYANVGVQDSIAWSSRVAGVLFLWLVARISVRLLPNATPESRLLFRLVYFASGATLLFFGYVENTPIAFAVEQLWVLCTLVWLGNPSWIRLCVMSVAFALATLCHGRVGFFAVPFVAASLLPHARPLKRSARATLSSALYIVVLTATVSAIFLLDRGNIIGGPYGNVTGGGNNTMFVSLASLATLQHWSEIASAFLISVGVLAPVGFLWMLLHVLWKRDAIILWASFYALASLIYVTCWEFDLGTFLDWDLVFSGAGALLFVTALALGSMRVSPWLATPPLVITSLVSLAFGMIANGEPFSVNWTPTASSGTLIPRCSNEGLQRTYFSDSELTVREGESDADTPNREWAADRTPLPLGERPFGARYQGYLNIPSAGTYWLGFMANGNVRVSVGERVLYSRWSGFEWRVTAERALTFPSAGWYPVTIEFFTTTTVVPLRVTLESRTVPQHPLTKPELCH